MKLLFRGLLPGEEPITSIAEYQQARREFAELDHQVHNLLLEIKWQRDSGQTPDPRLLAEFDLLDPQEKQTRYSFYRRLPYVLVSRCPYCQVPVWIKVGIFSLNDRFWYQNTCDGHLQAVLEESRCDHLFCVDGALNLNGYQPTEVSGPEANALVNQITMAAEVPFIKPRILNLPTMLAVVHSFPVAERYTAFPVAYFTEQRHDAMDFGIAWAATEYIGPAMSPGCTIVGRRSDIQSYDLEKWVQQEKLLWLNPIDAEHPLVSHPAKAFPYHNISGRQHPYLIQAGEVHDLPNPNGEGLTYYLEDPWGPRIMQH